ncbi:MAG: hypothetical protein ACRDN1_22220 [Trebonia sp.]
MSGNVIPGYAVLELNMRSYSAVTRQRMLDAIGRIARAECEASGSPEDPEFKTIFTFPVTDNDAAATGGVAKAFAAHFGDLAGEIPRQTVSEDFSKIPDAAHVPLQPTLRTGTEALAAAALAWLAPHRDPAPSRPDRWETRCTPSGTR